MSDLSTRRIKGSNGGTGSKPATQKPARTLVVPPSLSAKSSNHSLEKSSSGKENPRPASRPRGSTQKPLLRTVAGVENAVAGTGRDEEQRVRRSTSSVPRGRSSSPSDFARVISDLRREKGSRVSVDKFEKGLAKGAEKKGERGSSVQASSKGIGIFRDSKESSRVDDSFSKSNRVSEKVEKKDEKKLHLSSALVNNTGFKGRTGKGGSDSYSNLGSKTGSEETSTIVSKPDEKIGKCVDSSLKKEYSNQKGKVSEILKDSDNYGTSVANNKCPSKLHEKLAFLEGKVKRIASDIKKTKEILDMNNPDASKVMLSDIQEKISGIEKAMGNVASASGGKLGNSVSGGNDPKEVKAVNEIEDKQQEVTSVSMVKGLNDNDLEARLFPHHKLLRNRTSTKATSGSSLADNPPNIDRGSIESKMEVKPFCPVEENSIALEFLVSLDKEQSKVTFRPEQTDSQDCEIQETDGDAISAKCDSSNTSNEQPNLDLSLTTDEVLDEFDDQENRPTLMVAEENEDASFHQLKELGHKISTGGWFMSEGESVLLAHDDNSCSFHDIANCEEKVSYQPPVRLSPNIWRDCWIIRVAGADGCSGRYVVAASAGNTLDSGFCSWDFGTKQVHAFHIEDEGTTTSRTMLGPLPNTYMHRRNTLSSRLLPETLQWWYKPCGPLIVSTASSQRAVKVFDIRDGEQIMKWEVQKPASTMDYSSPLQWRNRGKVVIAETESLSVWDVNSLHPRALQSVSYSGRHISALHINNTDAELGGGVRQRVSSSEADGNDGVFCTNDSVNILDFRQPSGIGAKIPKLGVNVQSVFSRGDSIFLGCTNSRLAGRSQQACSQVQQFSLRKQRLISTYSLPESTNAANNSDITQVWGNSSLVMGVCGLGLFVFDAAKDDGLQCFGGENSSMQKFREIIGPNDLYSPSFDYSSTRVLLISRDRPALWRHLL